MFDVKAGWQTSEFWLSLISVAVTSLVALGVLTLGDASLVGGALSTMAVAAVAFVTNAVVVFKYISGRASQKTEATHATLVVEMKDAIRQGSSGPEDTLAAMDRMFTSAPQGIGSMEDLADK